jgi:DNA-3-methyladenine glycosylase II
MKPKTKKPRSMGHTAQEITKIRRLLSSLDPALALAHKAAPAFEWRVSKAGFPGLARIIVGQQVSTASANSIWTRFVAGVGEPSPRSVTAHDVESLKTFGLSRPKAVYIHGIATAVTEGSLDFANLADLDDEQAIAHLTALKGVGRWTAEAYLMFCEGRTDVFPAGDLALQEGFRFAAQARSRPSEKQLYARAERWRPYRGVAANLLWAYYRGVKTGAIVRD